MHTHYTSSVNTFDTPASYNQLSSPRQILQVNEERLPFTIKIAHSDNDMRKAIAIRHSAYARHIADLAEILKDPEQYDFDDGSAVLLAESKLDGSALGSMRIQTNRYNKLKLENSVQLPVWLQDHTLAEAGRLGVVGNRMGRIVKVLLFKAYYLYCLQEDIEWMVITARAPVDRDYDALNFKDVFPDAGYIPMQHDANVASRVMALNVASVEPDWKASNHVLYNLFFNTQHPDLDLSVAQKNSPLGIKQENASYSTHGYMS